MLIKYFLYYIQTALQSKERESGRFTRWWHNSSCGITFWGRWFYLVIHKKLSHIERGRKFTPTSSPSRVTSEWEEFSFIQKYVGFLCLAVDFYFIKVENNEKIRSKFPTRTEKTLFLLSSTSLEIALFVICTMYGKWFEKMYSCVSLSLPIFSSFMHAMKRAACACKFLRSRQMGVYCCTMLLC